MLSGTEAAALWKAEIAGRVGALAAEGKRVGLGTVLVGDDPASATYVRGKHRSAEEVGIASFDRTLPATASTDDVLRVVAELNDDPAVSGFIVQLPLPPAVDTEEVLGAIDPSKDADGLHPVNLGRLVSGTPGLRPATPSGILRLLHHYEIPIAEASVVIVGRSLLVGRPLGLMLSDRGIDATVTVAHSRTPDLASVTRRADILVVAAGRPGLIGPDHVQPGATVIDVGTTVTPDGLRGDVDPAVADVAGALSPVPGGVGPMTVAGLLANTLRAAEAS